MSSRGWCNSHYKRWCRHGDPLGGRKTRRLSGTPTERFWPKVDKTDGCWLWTAALSDGGYGVFGIGGRRVVHAHRFAYQQRVGPIPEGLHLDHLCRVRNCVNPDHLEPVTHAENVRRGLSGPKTHCGYGHEMNEANTYVNPNSGHRECRACHARRERNRRKR